MKDATNSRIQFLYICFVNDAQELKDEVAELCSGEDPTDVIMDLLQFHNQLVLLLHYHVLNCDGTHTPCTKFIT